MKKRNYPEGRTYFTQEEDAWLHAFNDEGLTLAEQAQRLSRPVGSIKTRRRLLGLSGSKPTAVGIDGAPVGYESEPWLTAFAVILSLTLFVGGVLALGGPY